MVRLDLRGEGSCVEVTLDHFFISFYVLLILHFLDSIFFLYSRLFYFYFPSVCERSKYCNRVRRPTLYFYVFSTFRDAYVSVCLSVCPSICPVNSFKSNKSLRDILPMYKTQHFKHYAYCSDTIIPIDNVL